MLVSCRVSVVVTLCPSHQLCAFFVHSFLSVLMHSGGVWAQVLELKERIHSEFQLGEVADQKLMYVVHGDVFN
jgi:hypothetical protein